ncbi:GTP pyrophosphokinase [Metaclostridioides mangenotii]|uniref:GTP pyrophosphokinase n=1 Tax=Metaclostridioides mangenotii TaxID=1540 RepID=UPI00047FFF24|nr:GTP pyrophosphokinase [Clostridioides mangenotii]
MGLKEFDFIEESIEMLRTMSPALESISDEIKDHFEEILKEKNQEYINLTSRIKSEPSLREKIIRNRYIKKYSEAGDLIDNMSDIIGIRIECRFIEDEAKIYRLFRRHFNKTDDKIYYYNKDNKSIKLKLSEKQPNKQKNGFEIYKIDGVYDYLNKEVNFELQIKSLVNVFWSEIEHKIIYKNNTYLLADKFIKDMMSSIRSNLTMIDGQLLSLYKNFNSNQKFNMNTSKMEMEKLFAKLVYDVFYDKMDSSIGFVVDFKKPCETILNYSFSKKEIEEDDLGEFMLEEFLRLGEIVNKEIDFNEELVFVNEPDFEDEFCKTVGEHFRSRLNTEFPWNLFFRILFEIEQCDNKQDFENFVLYIKENIISVEIKEQLQSYFKEDSDKIVDEIYKCVAESITKIDSVEILYNYNLEKIAFNCGEVVGLICREFDTYEEYTNSKEDLLTSFKEKITQIFE